MFQYEDFKRVALSDAEYLIPRLTASDVNTCELPFANLYAWGYSCDTRWAEYRRHLYFYLASIQRVTFMDAKDKAENPAPAELAEVLAEIRKHDGQAEFFQIRREYVESHPDLKRYFEFEPIEDANAEYIYSVQSLIELSGEKLRKKRNLIKQFLKAVPEPRIEAVTQGRILNDCLTLAAEWRAAQENPDTEALLSESDALSHLQDGFERMGCEGIAVYAGDKLAAFAVYARINGEMFTESFEKSRLEFRGAAQFINHEMAKRLDGRCLYINREQDLGSEGLKHAKLSYDPIRLQKNFLLKAR